MDREHLLAALAEHDADPDAVMAAFRVKRRRRARNRRLAVGGGLAAVGIVTAVAVVQPWAAAPSPTAARPATSRSATSQASGCASVSMLQTLATADRSGASIIVAAGSLTGKTATSEGQIYYQMLLHSVRTLSGPSVASGSTGWIGSTRGPGGQIPGADAGALWGADGRLFAIAWPAQVTGTAVGPVLDVAPVVHRSVILSSAGCWDSAGLRSRPYHGRLDLAAAASPVRCPATFSPFRCIPSELWAVENNLSISNMDWEEFARRSETHGQRRAADPIDSRGLD